LADFHKIFTQRSFHQRLVTAWFWWR